MELSIKPSPFNSYPLQGILIRGSAPAPWFHAIRQMRLSLRDIRLYPIPGTEANSVGGCLIICHEKPDPSLAGRHELCQMVTSGLLIPERSALFPALSLHELNHLFPEQVHLFHPEFGLAELPGELDLKTLIALPELKSYHVIRPEEPVFMPSSVRSFQVKPLPPEEVMKQMEEMLFPQTGELPKEELSRTEKARLEFYNLLYGHGDQNAKREGPAGEAIDALAAKLGGILGSMIPRNSKLAERMQRDFEALKRRNQAEIDKLMELFKSNPEEALKYAIPLDETGSVRGGESQEFSLSKRWSNFSLGNLSPGSGSGSGSVDLGDHYRELQQQYNQTAEDLIKKQEYHKAAFVYMKLLKNVHRAAATLEEGGLYQDAAALYLKHANNKQKAAECYEKGKMIHDAIGLYKELKQDEKVGDLYVSINRRREANVHYGLVIDDYRGKDQFLKASLVCRDKMLNFPESQDLLIEGWRKQKDAFNCLNNYFSNIGDVKTLKQEIHGLYEEELTGANSATFLKAISYEYHKHDELKEDIKDIAYEIVASKLASDSQIVNELKTFNEGDKELYKDLQRFTQGKRR